MAVGVGGVVVKELTLHLPGAEINSRATNRRRRRTAVPARAGRTRGGSAASCERGHLAWRELGEGGGQRGGQGPAAFGFLECLTFYPAYSY